IWSVWQGVRRVIAEDRHAIEWTIGFREIHPTLGLQMFRRSAFQSNADDVRAREFQSRLRQIDKFIATTQTQQLSERQSANQSVILPFTTVGRGHLLRLWVDFPDRIPEMHAFLR